MIKTVILKNQIIEYELQYKKVKNINLRIKSDGKVYVSASKKVPEKYIEEFLKLKAEFIFKAIQKYKNKSETPKIQHFSEKELLEFITEFCEKIYPYYEELGVAYPQIKFRKMVSCWGVCHTKKGVVTFNKNLIFAPKECVQYVIWHEFTHFLVPNHSDKFYNELSKVFPDWKNCRNILKGISIRS